jgi:fructose/tagatose bisphosphate aldolase
VPAALILNEASRVPLLLQGLEAGFNVIMHDHQGCSLEQSLAINQELVRAAHAAGAEVEAEIGELPAHDLRTNRSIGGEKTDPEAAAAFVRRTGVDALAVAVGNVHMLEGRKAALDLDLIRTLCRRIEVPLVLHGGTGIQTAALAEAIRLGISKINVGTVLRRTFLLALDGYFRTHETARVDPNEGTSTGGEEDLLAGARRLIAEEVGKMMSAFGSAGMASRFREEEP